MPYFFNYQPDLFACVSAGVSGPGSLSTWRQTCYGSSWEKITRYPPTLSSTSHRASYMTPSAYARSAAVSVRCMSVWACAGKRFMVKCLMFIWMKMGWLKVCLVVRYIQQGVHNKQIFKFWWLYWDNVMIQTLS